MSETLRIDILILKRFFDSFIEQYKDEIIIGNYWFYIFVCPYNRDSGLWYVQSSISPDGLKCYCPQNSLTTKIDAESIFDLLRKSGAEIKYHDDYVWKVNILKYN